MCGERGQKRRGRNKSSEQIKELKISDTELFERWKNGEKIRDLGKRCGVSYGVIRSKLIKHDEKAYREIARIKKARRGVKELSVSASKLYEQWKNGKSTRALAKKYKVSRQTIKRRLKEYNEQEYDEIAKNKIATSIAERRKNIPVPPTKILDRWKKGESAAKLAEQFNVSRPTITRILEKYGEKDYEKIAKDRVITGRTKQLPVPISEVFEKWAKGESPEDLEKLCNISYRQILEKMKVYDPARYKEIAERRGLGSIRAKPYGARSLFELNVRRILEKYGIYSKETTLKLGKHRWRPDFALFDQNTIIEAMGLNFNSYWKRNDRKTRDYIHYKYKAVAVVPNEQLYQKAIRCLTKKVKIVKYEDFDEFVATSLKKAPKRKTLSPREKAFDNSRGFCQRNR